NVANPQLIEAVDQERPSNSNAGSAIPWRVSPNAGQAVYAPSPSDIHMIGPLDSMVRDDAPTLIESYTPPRELEPRSADGKSLVGEATTVATLSAGDSSRAETGRTLTKPETVVAAPVARPTPPQAMSLLPLNV